MQSVTLTTDWGKVSQEKIRWQGWLSQQRDWLDVTSLTDEIEPFNTLQAQHIVHGFLTQWPKETIHIVLVDAEAQRILKLVWLIHPAYSLLLPDTPFWHFFYTPECLVYEAAQFQPGVKLVDMLIQAMESLKSEKVIPKKIPVNIPENRMRAPEPRLVDGMLHGEIMWMDHFGNLETNIRRKHLDELGVKNSFHVVLRRQDSRQGLSKGYSDVPVSSLAAFFNSRGWLEIAIRGDHAGRLLGMQPGMNVLIEP